MYLFVASVLVDETAEVEQMKPGAIALELAVVQPHNLYRIFSE